MTILPFASSQASDLQEMPLTTHVYVYNAMADDPVKCVTDYAGGLAYGSHTYAELTHIYLNIDPQGISQFPAKEEMIASLKQGSCKEVFAKYYSAETFNHITGAFDDFSFLDGFLGHNKNNRRSHYTNLESFLTDYDGMIYFFYSLSQIKNPTYWKLPLDILGEFGERRDGGKELIKSPDSVHQYFRGMAGVFELIDRFPQGSYQVISRNLKRFCSDLENTNSFFELTHALKHMVVLHGNGHLNNFICFLQQHKGRSLLYNNCPVADLMSIFYLTLKETPKLEQNQNIFSTWASMIKKNHEGSTILKAFIMNNKNCLFNNSLYDGNLLSHEKFELLSLCKNKDKETCVKVVKLSEVFSSQIADAGHYREKYLEKMLEIKTPQPFTLFYDLAIEHQDVFKKHDHFMTLIDWVLNENSTNLAQALNEAGNFQDLIENYGLWNFLLCHSFIADSAHWEMACELDPDFDLAGAYGIDDFKTLLQYLSIIKDPADWETAMGLAHDLAPSEDESSLKPEDLANVFRYFNGNIYRTLFQSEINGNTRSLL